MKITIWVIKIETKHHLRGDKIIKHAPLMEGLDVDNNKDFIRYFQQVYKAKESMEVKEW